MNKLKMLLVVFISTLTVLGANAQTSNTILGTYFSPNKKSKIEFVEKEGLYYGILIWNVNPYIKDKFNKNKELQTLNLIGQAIFKNLKYNKKECFWIGKFYDSESGKTYDCNLWFEDDNKTNLITRGYIDKPIIGKTKMLKRIEEE